MLSKRQIQRWNQCQMIRWPYAPRSADARSRRHDAAYISRGSSPCSTWRFPIPLALDSFSMSPDVPVHTKFYLPVLQTCHPCCSFCRLPVNFAAFLKPYIEVKKVVDVMAYLVTRCWERGSASNYCCICCGGQLGRSKTMGLFKFLVSISHSFISAT